jgi:hypothetical protein
MPILTKTVLENIGITLSDEDYASLSEHFESTLNERVVDEIALELTPEQAAELATLEHADDTTISQWLQANVPDLGEIISDEVDILLGELAEGSSNLE